MIPIYIHIALYAMPMLLWLRSHYNKYSYCIQCKQCVGSCLVVTIADADTVATHWPRSRVTTLPLASPPILGNFTRMNPYLADPRPCLHQSVKKHVSPITWQDRFTLKFMLFKNSCSTLRSSFSAISMLGCGLIHGYVGENTFWNAGMNSGRIVPRYLTYRLWIHPRALDTSTMM